MRVAWIVFFFFFGSMLFLVSPQLNSRQAPTTVQRDPQALAILQQSVAAMALAPPADSSATGTVTIVEGSTTESGSIQIQTLGSAQTSETLTLPGGQRVVVYSNGAAKETYGTHSANPSLQLILTDQCPDFPLPLLVAALNNPDSSFHYIGTETINGTAAQHVQFWNSFASKQHLQNLAEFSLKDVWIDPSSALPLKIGYFRREGSGTFSAIPVEVTFSNYTNVSGVLYPYQISKSFNGTPWQTITIQNVSLNVGLTDSQFSVE